METKYFTLLELFKAREYLSAIMNSTGSFTHVKWEKEELQAARIRLKQIDQELKNRLAGKGWQAPVGHKIFQDKSFEKTLEENLTKNPEE